MKWLVHSGDIDEILFWQPINELPGYPDQSLDKDSEEYWDQQFDFSLPPGIVLRKKNGEYVLIGHDTYGRRTAGCSCCSVDWIDRLEDFDAFACLMGYD